MKMITRETLERMQHELPTMPWSQEDLEGLLELLQYWFPLFAKLDELDFGDLGPFPSHEID